MRTPVKTELRPGTRRSEPSNAAIWLMLYGIIGFTTVVLVSALLVSLGVMGLVPLASAAAGFALALGYNQIIAPRTHGPALSWATEYVAAVACALVALVVVVTT